MKVTHFPPGTFVDGYHIFEASGSPDDIAALQGWLHDPERNWNYQPGINPPTEVNGTASMGVGWPEQEGKKDAAAFKLLWC